MARSGFLSLAGEFWMFLRVRKKWWLAPIVIILALFGSLIVFTQGSALAPFVYTIF
jgi:drug/metabolite transporter superfamily protein YnfA